MKLHRASLPLVRESCKQRVSCRQPDFDASEVASQRSWGNLFRRFRSIGNQRLSVLAAPLESTASTPKKCFAKQKAKGMLR